MLSKTLKTIQNKELDCITVWIKLSKAADLYKPKKPREKRKCKLQIKDKEYEF